MNLFKNILSLFPVYAIEMLITSCTIQFRNPSVRPALLSDTSPYQLRHNSDDGPTAVGQNAWFSRS